MLKDGKHRRNERGISILASNIKKYRKEQHLTIQELANKLDVDYSQIGRMERGIVNPNVSIIFDIAEVLQIKASQLLEE
ncbi:helix-turn-helix domain-containing protein [Pedobacter sp. MC2016-24]|uniref:helix-turn-helix domain-containing protein n=1 Tax=Pedobacter sp. MC2016-24 TaxID=2780090 RepID=UPI00187FFB04|nr:helix-turn-helix transcriptional regulator [Pedobacter sp. MC2016-24]MBE9602972.1 helix-turn-helix transcriptional regulator [Pedobacter sp. MC2016-24]